MDTCRYVCGDPYALTSRWREVCVGVWCVSLAGGGGGSGGAVLGAGPSVLRICFNPHGLTHGVIFLRDVIL